MHRLGLWRGETLCQRLAHWTESTPDHIAVIDPANREALTGTAPQRLSYLQLNELADIFANALLDLGLERGDRCMVLLPNVVELMALYCAASKLGVVISPIPVQYGHHEVTTLTMSRAREVADGAISSLESVPDGVVKEALIRFARQVVDRTA